MQCSAVQVRQCKTEAGDRSDRTNTRTVPHQDRRQAAYAKRPASIDTQTGNKNEVASVGNVADTEGYDTGAHTYIKSSTQSLTHG